MPIIPIKPTNMLVEHVGQGSANMHVHGTFGVHGLENT